MNLIRRICYLKAIENDHHKNEYEDILNAIYFYLAGERGEKRKYVEELCERYVRLCRSKHVEGKYWIGSISIPGYLQDRLIESYKRDAKMQSEQRTQTNIEEFNTIFNVENNNQQLD